MHVIDVSEQFCCQLYLKEVTRCQFILVGVVAPQVPSRDQTLVHGNRQVLSEDNAGPSAWYKATIVATVI
jgi:hypothetical protein